MIILIAPGDFDLPGVFCVRKLLKIIFEKNIKTREPFFDFGRISK